MSREAEFFETLFSCVPPGQIEVRAIEDKKGGRVFNRAWYKTPADLVAKLDSIANYCTSRRAAAFFGVIPRADGMDGRDGKLIAGLAAWADVDFKSISGGETEARARIEALPLPPTAITRSGHGLHVYYILREPEEPDVLSKLAARLGAALGGDRVHDTARVMRMPGTMNMKDPANPVRVEIEVWEPSRRCNPSELAEMLPELPAASEKSTVTAPEKPSIATSLPPRVKQLIESSKRIGDLYHGRGKPDTDDNGRPLDTTSSGYDVSFLMALAKKGVRDFSDLASALYPRADDAARTKGVDYIRRTVQYALERVPEKEEKRKEPFQLDFEVEKVLMFASVPPQIVLRINGRDLALTVPDLLSETRFKTKFVETMRWIPRVPHDEEQWTEIGNGWLAQAETIEQPPEASTEEHRRIEIARIIDEAGVTESIDDLDRFLVIVHDGVRLFKSTPLLKRVRQDLPEITSPALCRHLRELGYSPRSVRIDEGVARVWGRFTTATGVTPISSI
jgi:hypothetical protein